MPDKALFRLAVVHRPGEGYFGMMSAYDLTGGARALVDRINADLRALPLGDGRKATERALHAFLQRKYGFGEVNAGDWYEDPRPSTDEPPPPRTRFAQE